MRRRRQRRRERSAFTLVEMLVAMALILFIMVILSEAFVAGLESFRQLKALGDLEERLRTAATEIRRDLNADHFEGRRRLSDSNILSSPPREGFFQIIQGSKSMVEGVDDSQIPSYHAIDHRLHFSVKLRENKEDRFFKTVLPDSRLNTVETVFFSQAADGRFQDAGTTANGVNIYSSPWAEVAYFLKPDPAGANAGSGTPLYSLYRAQLLVVPDNRLLNWPDPTGTTKGFPLSARELGNYAAFSCQAVGSGNNTGRIYFNCPSDLAQGKRAISTADLSKPPTALVSRSTLLLPDVISFQVQIMGGLQASSATGATNLYFQDLTFPDPFDTIGDKFSLLTGPIPAIQVTLRVWDAKTEQARQISIIQDM